MMAERKSKNPTPEVVAVRARVGFVRDGVHYAPNDLIEFTPEVLAGLDADLYDDTPEGVEWCIQQSSPLVRHGAGNED